jgi:flagellin
MPLSINTNIASMTAQRSFLSSNQALETSFERLATGKRVNSAVDDAAGLAIGTDLQSRVGGLNQAIRNVNDGISMVQIAEGAYSEVTNILQRMRDLAVQAANGAVTSTEQSYLDTEHSKLATALGQAIDSAKFNGTDMIADGAQTSKVIQSGADAADRTTINFKALTETLLGVDATQVDLTGTSQVKESAAITSVNLANGAGTYTLKINGVDYTTASGTITTAAALATALNIATADDGTVLGDLYTVTKTADGSGSPIDGAAFTVERDVFGDDAAVGGGSATSYILSFSGTDSGSNFAAGTVGTPTDGTSQATDAITAIDTALDKVASERATLGATQAQLESMVRNLSNVAENTSAAAGRIMDTDYAAETANLTKAQILQQAATSILAQANAQPQAVLSLLQ